MKSFSTVLAFLFLLAWLVGFFLLQPGLSIHLLLFCSIALVMLRLGSGSSAKEDSSAA